MCVCFEARIGERKQVKKANAFANVLPAEFETQPLLHPLSAVPTTLRQHRSSALLTFESAYRAFRLTLSTKHKEEREDEGESQSAARSAEETCLMKSTAS